MKKTILLILFLVNGLYNSYAQTDTSSTEEYAIVKAKVYFLDGKIVDPFNGHPNPTVSYAGINEGKFAVTLKYVHDVMNFMNKLGWKYINSDVLNLGNNDNSKLINTNEYLQILYFKKEIKSKTGKL